MCWPGARACCFLDARAGRSLGPVAGVLSEETGNDPQLPAFLASGAPLPAVAGLRHRRTMGAVDGPISLCHNRGLRFEKVHICPAKAP
jgi:hypothetical protein